jgi:hypothetical protein
MDSIAARKRLTRVLEYASVTLFFILILFGVLLKFSTHLTLAIVGVCLACFWLLLADPVGKKPIHFVALFAAFFVTVLIRMYGEWTQARDIRGFEAYLVTHGCTYSHEELRGHPGGFHGWRESEYTPPSEWEVSVYECAKGTSINFDFYQRFRPE